MDKDKIITKFHMIPHEEGGFYAEVMQLTEPSISRIYYLLEKGKTAQWHRIGSDELWLYHDGGELILTLGGTEDAPSPQQTFRLNREDPCVHVPKHHWQTAKALADDVLVSCVVAPAFSREQWELYPKEDQK